MSEAWFDQEGVCLVTMTPEGDPADLDKEFDSYESFFEWYYHPSESLRKELRMLNFLVDAKRKDTCDNLVLNDAMDWLKENGWESFVKSNLR